LGSETVAQPGGAGKRMKRRNTQLFSWVAACENAHNKRVAPLKRSGGVKSRTSSVTRGKRF